MEDIPFNDAKTKRLLDNLTGFLKGTKRNHSGVRLIDELMVDIMGGLIPGVLFIFSLMVCFILPIIIYKCFQPTDYQTVKEALENHVIVLGESMPVIGGWFWFAAFLTFLILSYIAGHIFYRSDTNKADRDDIKRRVNRKTKEIRKTLSKSKDITKTIEEMLSSELRTLKSDVELIPGLRNNSNLNDLKLLLNHINSSIVTFNNLIKESAPDANNEGLEGATNGTDNGTNPKESASNGNAESSVADSGRTDKGTNPKEDTSDGKTESPGNNILLLVLYSVLFPHCDSNNPNPWDPSGYKESSNYLLFDEYKIFSKAQKKARCILLYSKPCYFIKCISKKLFNKTVSSIHGVDNISLLACYLILLLQNDSGCSHYDKQFEKQSYFPYLNFYKYLLKRKEYDLIQYVDWSPAGARSKNKINRMKIDVQLDYPDAYAIINKNESHIRMASSTWYVSRFIRVLAFWSFIVVCILILGLYNVEFEFIPIKEITLSKVYHCIDYHKIAKISAIALPPFLLAYLMHRVRYQIAKFIHYQRLREIFFALYIFHKLNEKKQIKSTTIKQIRDLIQIATQENLKSFISSINDINTAEGGEQHMIADIAERLSAPIYFIWEYLGYGSTDKLSEKECKPCLKVLFESSPENYLLECIELLSSDRITIPDKGALSERKEHLLNFYIELIKSYK